VKILSGRQRRPRRVLLYGQEGVGKSTWAAGAPRPIFLDCEGGLADIEADKSPRLRTIDDVLGALRWLWESPHDYQSVVLDTVDWVERMIHAKVCQDDGVKSIEKAAGGYGKGYIAAATEFEKLLANMESLSRKRGMNLILLGHCSPVKVLNPEAETYEQWAPDLHKAASSVLREWCDEVFFASYRTLFRTVGDSKQRTLAVGDDERYIRTRHGAAVQAKNRLNLPEELPMIWAEYQRHWPTGNAERVSGNVPVASETVTTTSEEGTGNG
jgi:hypothetical protein